MMGREECLGLRNKLRQIPELAGIGGYLGRKEAI